jgi:hypothetical protein
MIFKNKGWSSQLTKWRKQGFVFEREYGNSGDDYSRKVLAESILITYNVDHLEKLL